MVAGCGCNDEFDLASEHRSEIRFEFSNLRGFSRAAAPSELEFANLPKTISAPELLKFLSVASASPA
jgi:hypothetical protein